MELVVVHMEPEHRQGLEPEHKLVVGVVEVSTKQSKPMVGIRPKGFVRMIPLVVRMDRRMKLVVMGLHRLELLVLDMRIHNETSVKITNDKCSGH